MVLINNDNINIIINVCNDNINIIIIVNMCVI